MKRGEIRSYTFEPPDKRRPVPILTRTPAIRYLNSVTVAPLTSTIRGIPSEVALDPEQDGVVTVCAANLDNVQTVSKFKVGDLIMTLSTERMRAVDGAICFALGVET